MKRWEEGMRVMEGSGRGERGDIMRKRGVGSREKMMIGVRGDNEMRWQEFGMYMIEYSHCL